MNPVILPREAHSISRSLIQPEALRVLYGLHRAGYRAYLCGGGVRDLLLGITPKDFDIATSALPQEVRKVFRNCRIIGRRFRLAHVFFRDVIVEVSTFRRRAVVRGDGDEGEEVDGDLLITDDNVFGTPEEDAQRRDFTVNGLFYDIGSFSVIDYVGGLPDLKERLIRSIGEPSVRFREDPVRMLRAVKLAARLNFAIDAADWEAIREHAADIKKSAAPRVLEELLKILKGGAAERSFQLLEQSGLAEVLLPELRHVLEEARVKETTADRELYGNLRAIDRMAEAGRDVDNAVVMSAVLAPWLVPSKVPLTREKAMRVRGRLEPLRERLAIGKRDVQLIRTLLVLAHRIRWRWSHVRSRLSLMKLRAFPLSVDLLEIGLEAQGKALPEELADLRDECAKLWDARGQRVGLLPGEESDALRPKNTRRRRRRKPKAAAAPDAGRAPAAPREGQFAKVQGGLGLPSQAGGSQPSSSEDGARGRRRRRRRRGGRGRRGATTASS
ncbi:MAG: polynucleotide adenylyltransferase PcnB [Acidobacteriota bacterium]